MVVWIRIIEFCLSCGGRVDGDDDLVFFLPLVIAVQMWDANGRNQMYFVNMG